jgi:3-deoxy-D-manno-octulosonate 8-phosphate phosphatase (KDO 8-P phosphatase)
MTRIRLIACDIDGTLTSGGVHFDSHGEEEKVFSVLDGLGFRLAEEADVAIAVISGRRSKPVAVRMATLPKDNVLLQVGDKKRAITLLQARLGIRPDETAFVGDDLNDLPAFEAVGLRIAVANAVPQLKRRADFITKRSGGSGACREAIEWILNRQNAYGDAVNEYFERELSNV